MRGIWLPPKPAILAAVKILDDAFTGQDGTVWASVSTKLPARNRPERFVTVTRVGGGQPDQSVDVARILIQCYGRDTATVEQMCNTARAGFRNTVGTTVEAQAPWNQTAGGVERMFIRWYGSESGLADLPHPDLLDYERWQFTAELWVKAN